MELVTPQYKTQLDVLARELVTPQRFKPELVDRALGQTVELILNPEPPKA